jgi:hypothetical protein
MVSRCKLVFKKKEVVVNAYTRIFFICLATIAYANNCFGMKRTAEIRFVLSDAFFEATQAQEQHCKINYDAIAQEFLTKIQNNSPDLKIYYDYFIPKQSARETIFYQAIVTNADMNVISWIIDNILIPYKDYQLIGKGLLWAAIKGNVKPLAVLCTQYSTYITLADIDHALEALMFLACHHQKFAKSLYSYLLQQKASHRIEEAIYMHPASFSVAQPKMVTH